MGLRTTFRIPPTGVFEVFNQIEANTERVELNSAIIARDNVWFEYLTVVTEPETQLSTLIENQRVKTVETETVSPLSGMRNYLLRVEEVPPFIITTLTENEAIPHRAYLENGSVTVVAIVDDWNHLKEIADTVEAAYSSFELVGTSQVSGASFLLGSRRHPFAVYEELSEEQLQTLVVAYEKGFFEVPQEVTSTEIAEELGLSQSAVSERLRRAQQNVCQFLFGNR